jgi:hypothetical protein
MPFVWIPLIDGENGTDMDAGPLNELAAKVGDDGSAVPTSLDYLLKHPSSLNPGHKHSLLDELGINTGGIDPVTKLQVAETITTSPRGIMSSQYNTGADGARLHLRKARGTPASPAAVLSGDNLGRLVASGYDGTNYLEMTSIIFGTQGTIEAGRVPTYLAFLTATDTSPSVLTEWVRLTAQGYLGVRSQNPLRSLWVANGLSATVLYHDGTKGIIGTNYNAGGSATPLQIGYNETNQIYLATNGYVGFGTALPSAKHSVVDGEIHVTVHSSSNFPLSRWRRARGTEASPAPVLNGDVIGDWTCQAYNAGGFRNAGHIRYLVDGTPGATYVPSKIQLGTYDLSGNPNWAFTINNIGNVSIGTGSPNAAALLHLASTTKGFLPPVMTTAQKSAISSPPAGLVVYDSNLSQLGLYSAAWEAIPTVITKADTGDPTGREGLVCINTFDNTVKIFADAAWRQLASW